MPLGLSRAGTAFSPGHRFEWVVSAAVPRFRPVLTAALTTVPGMLPLHGDPFFRSMATAITFGSTFAAGLTLCGGAGVLQSLLRYRTGAASARLKKGIL